MKRRHVKTSSFMLLELLLITAVIAVFAYLLAKVYLKNIFPTSKDNQQYLPPKYINSDKYNSVINNVHDDVNNMNQQINDLQKQLQKM